jgi:type VI secretion system protein ImpB
MTMASESMQHKNGRVRRPRVHITFDVETGTGLQKVELPFMVGVVADLSAQSDASMRPIKQRAFVPIDRDNFHEVLHKAAPRLAFKVTDRLTDSGGNLPIELRFRHLDDFQPDRVAEQIPALRELLTMRQQFTQLLSKLEGNDRLEQLLNEILADAGKAQALSRFLKGPDPRTN